MPPTVQGKRQGTIACLRRLSKEDRRDFIRLFTEFHETDDPEEQEEILKTLEELIRPVEKAKRLMPEPDEGSKWAVFVAKKVRELRLKRGYTQGVLAQLAGIPQSHLSRIEQARLSPTHFTLTKLAKALRVSVKRFDPSS